MVHLDARSALCDLREALCPRSPDSTYADNQIYKICQGIVFNLDIKFSDYDKGTRECNSRVNVLFFGNTSVFWKYENEKWTDARFTCQHDSCWRSDGLIFLSEIYFDSCASANNEKRPIDINQFTTFSYPTPFNLVEVTWGRDPKDGHRYKRILVDIKPLGMTVLPK